MCKWHAMISVNMWPIKFEYRARPGKKIKEGDQSVEENPPPRELKKFNVYIGFFSGLIEISPD